MIGIKNILKFMIKSNVNLFINKYIVFIFYNYVII